MAPLSMAEAKPLLARFGVDPEYSWPTRSTECAKGHVDPVDDIKTLSRQMFIVAEDLCCYSMPNRWSYFREKALEHGLEYPEHCTAMHAKKCMDEFGRERLPADLLQYLDALAKYVRYYMQRKRLQLVVKHMKLERRKRLYDNPWRAMRREPELG